MGYKGKKAPAADADGPMRPLEPEAPLNKGPGKDSRLKNYMEVTLCVYNTTSWR